MKKIEIENYLHQEINHRKSNKCSGSCSNINNPLAKACVPDVVKNKSKSAKVFNLVSGTNETRRIECHETCKCKRTLHHIVCNNTQRWNDDKECKELIDKGVCGKRFILNPSKCECECYRSCDFSEYSDYKNC